MLTLLQKRQASWIIAVLGALSLDAFRLGSWPWFTIFICVYVLVLQLLVTHVLTNRSFYSAFSLLAVGRLAGWLILWLSHESIALWPAPLGLTYGWKGVIFQLVLDAIWILLWYLVSYWARRTLRINQIVIEQNRWLGPYVMSVPLFFNRSTSALSD